jgi:hypothetical protein
MLLDEKERAAGKNDSSAGALRGLPTTVNLHSNRQTLRKAYVKGSVQALSRGKMLPNNGITTLPLPLMSKMWPIAIGQRLQCVSERC